MKLAMTVMLLAAVSGVLPAFGQMQVQRDTYHNMLVKNAEDQGLAVATRLAQNHPITSQTPDTANRVFVHPSQPDTSRQNEKTSHFGIALLVLAILALFRIAARRTA